MKTRTKILIGTIIAAVLTAGLITGGLLIVKHNIEQTEPTKKDYITNLKEHEKEMTDFVISENPKVTSVQWDWDSMKVRPTGGVTGLWSDGKGLILYGKFNQIEDSSFYMKFDLDEKENIIFDPMWSSKLHVGSEFYE